MASTEEIFLEAMALPAKARAELAERLIGSLAEEISPDIANTHLEEVRRRIAQVQAGEASLVAGDEVLARVRALQTGHLPPT
jgi:putative addiction module component (TIGR02574 family)